VFVYVSLLLSALTHHFTRARRLPFFSAARVCLQRQSDVYFIGFLKHFDRDRHF